MFKIIEITKNIKPEGKALKVGGTSESDFYIKGTNTYYSDKYNSSTPGEFIRDYENMIRRKNFEFSLEFNAYRRRLNLEVL